MKSYVSFFKLRFQLGLQYRGAALAGITTQLAWGFLEMIMFHTFYKEYSSSFPMTMRELGSYIWLRQALLSLFILWNFEGEIFRLITSGDVSYELCKPQDIYSMWFARSVANRLSKVVLRAVPVIFVAIVLPKPYGLNVPASLWSFLMFVITLFLGLIVVVAFTMLVYVLCFFTTSHIGIRIFAVSFGELLGGDIVPLPFFPEKIRRVVELLPFASMSNVPLRVYSGSMACMESIKFLLIQLLWIVLLIGIGKILCRKAMCNIAVMGG